MFPVWSVEREVLITALLAAILCGLHELGLNLQRNSLTEQTWRWAQLRNESFTAETPVGCQIRDECIFLVSRSAGLLHSATGFY
jgi:hypothetical protein